MKKEREIKFKAIIAGTESWIYGLPHSVYGTGIDSIQNDTNGNIEYINVDTLCQYTGLKDMSGKDIYEDDILDSETAPEPLQITIDDYHGYQFKFGEGTLCKADAIYGVVIGNIYDNPELLVPKI